MDLLYFATKQNNFWFKGTFYLQQRGMAIGAKFAPSLVNLLMAQWEENVVYALNRPELVLWARYINDILLLWQRDHASLCDFMTILNHNNRGIQLSYEASTTSILEIIVQDWQLVTKTFFKTTDRNGYIPVDSCHHVYWLKSIPRGPVFKNKNKLH